MMSSPTLPPQSEDELFRPQNTRPVEYETIETVPLNHLRSSPELDTLASLRTIPTNGYQTQRGGLDTQSQYGYNNQNTTRSQYITQPTQIINRHPTEISSPPANSVVQVAASSPVTTPIPPSKRPGGILASAMAPAGTAFRRPYVAPALSSKNRPVLVNSDDEEQLNSSDSDRAEQARTNIKTSTFKRAAEKVPESPETGQGLSRFQQITQASRYNAGDPVQGYKRSADTMADAYGNAYKKPRQAGPSRAMPVMAQQVEEEEDLDLNDIMDQNARSKVRRMRSIYPTERTKDLYEALQAKRGNFEDAVEHVMNLSEKRDKQKRNAIDLTGSDDELMMTPAIARKKAPVAAPVVQDTRQQARKPTKNITEKWSSTQAVRNPSISSKKLDIFDDPGPAPPKARKLIRGRREPSPPTQEQTRKVSQERSKPAIVLSDDSDDDAVNANANASEPEDGDFNDRLLSFFNTCSAMDLADTASISVDIAEHFIAKRPYRSISAVEKVENPNLKPSKSRRKTPPMGEKVVEKVEGMLKSYEAVDYLVKRCENIAKPLANEMKGWGVDVYGKSGSEELDMTSLPLDSHRASTGSHDSGLGTPISDDDRDAIRGAGSKKLIGQPSLMAEDITMKDYQVIGINWLNLLFRKRYSCILADDMGLGKTLQTIAFLAHLRQTNVPGPHLIVVPAATLENWLKEFARFCPYLRVEPYYATNPTERLELREVFDHAKENDEVDVLVTTYTIAKAKDDFPWLRTFGFCCTIFDEGHVLKNADSKVSRNLMRIQSKWRLLLTGTPLQNNLKELMSLLFFLMPEIFRQKQEDLEMIFKQDVKTINENAASREMLLSKERIARARSMLTPFILRRKKWQVLKDLPKKERMVEYCEMTDAQEGLYNGWLAKAYDIRERRAKGENIPINETTNILMRLRQAAIHPLLFRRIYKDEDLKKIARACLKDPLWAESNPALILEELTHYSDFEIYQLCVKSAPLQKFVPKHEELLSSGKVQAMLRLLERFIEGGHRVLIFSQFVMVLDILEVVLSKQGIRFFRLDGNTKVNERQDLIDEFNEEIPEDAPDAAERKLQQVPVFMLSTKAGGAGINLASASRVIVFDSGFNPQDDVQAENRAHRIGQKKEVEIWRLVTKGSVEEQIHDMGVVKLRLDREVAGEGAEDGEENAGKKTEKKTDAKELEGMRTVEAMLFKKLDETPKKPNLEQALSPVSPSKKTAISDAADISVTGDKAPGGVQKQNIQKSSDASVIDVDDTDQKSDDDDDDNDTRNSSQSAQPKGSKAVKLSTRTKASARPKVGSRKSSSQSQSQSQGSKTQTKLSFKK